MGSLFRPWRPQSARRIEEDEPQSVRAVHQHGGVPIVVRRLMPRSEIERQRAELKPKPERRFVRPWCTVRLGLADADGRPPKVVDPGEARRFSACRAGEWLWVAYRSQDGPARLEVFDLDGELVTRKAVPAELRLDPEALLVPGAELDPGTTIWYEVTTAAWRAVLIRPEAEDFWLALEPAVTAELPAGQGQDPELLVARDGRSYRLDLEGRRLTLERRESTSTDVALRPPLLAVVGAWPSQAGPRWELEQRSSWWRAEPEDEDDWEYRYSSGPSRQRPRPFLAQTQVDGEVLGLAVADDALAYWETSGKWAPGVSAKVLAQLHTGQGFVPTRRRGTNLFARSRDGAVELTVSWIELRPYGYILSFGLEGRELTVHQHDKGRANTSQSSESDSPVEPEETHLFDEDFSDESLKRLPLRLRPVGQNCWVAAMEQVDDSHWGYIRDTWKLRLDRDAGTVTVERSHYADFSA